jgi:phosphoribosyl 1,2-cyclic phosphodiesterase
LSFKEKKMIGFCPLASGSKGNCIYIGTEKTKLLIDVGISTKVLKQRLELIGVDLNQIDAIIITHEHTDHIKGLERIACEGQIPVFANGDTACAITSYVKKIPRFKIFSTGEYFSFGDIEIFPFSIPHDAADPVGFTIHLEGLKVGICADLGFVSTSIVQTLKKCDYLYVEANHQPSMVYASTRPAIYKQRVLGRQGHLSNEECSSLIEQIFHPDLKQIYLAHLSSECNHPDLALDIMQKKLTNLRADTKICIAYQQQLSQPVLF